MSANPQSSNERPSASHRSSLPRPINNPRHQNSFWRRSQRQRQPDGIPSQPQQSAPSEVTVPPPHSTPHPISDEENTLPPPTLEATLVRSAEATLIVPNTSPIYEATQITTTGGPWWKRYKNYFLVALISLVIGGMAMTIAMLVVGNSGNNGNEVDVQPVEQTPVTTVPEAEEDDTASDMLVINGNNGSQVDTQIIEQTPITTNPPASMLNSTTQSPVPPPSNPPSNEITVAPTTAVTLAPVTRPTSVPVPTTWAPTLRAALSPMEQLQSSALELIPSEVIYSHSAHENVAMHGDTVIVGAPNNNNQRGFVIVYVRDGKGGWSEQAKLEAPEAPDGGDGEHFGGSVAIHGNTVIVGAYWDDDNGRGSGSGYVFVRNGGTWIHQAKLLALDGVAYGRFGHSVGIFDDTVIIGANGDNSYLGSAYLFVRKNGIWTQQAKLTAPDRNGNDEFGFSVGIFLDTVIVGAPDDDDNGSNSGSAYLFALKEDIWIHQAKLTAPDGNAKDNFGRIVEIFGDTVIVGAPNDDDNGSNSGSAQVFTLDNDIWTHQAKLLAPDGAADDRFGWSVGIFGDTVVVGSWNDDDNGADSGSLYLFTHDKDAWDYHAKLLAPNLGTQFGQSVVTYNGTVVAGSYSGEVYLFSSDSD